MKKVMSYLCFVVIIVGIIGSCDQEHKRHVRYVIFKIGACEYIEDTNHNYPLVHKGDCRNPIHHRP